MSSTEIATRDPGTVMQRIESLTLPEVFTEQFPAFDMEAGLLEAVIENLDDETIPINELPQITLPLGGMTSWQVPDIDARSGFSSREELTGILMAKRPRRAFWPGVQITGDPPTCVSVDGKLGQGAYGRGSDANPSGSCRTCPQAQWGTRRNIGGPSESNAQACSQFKTLLLLREGDALPTRVKAPATSIKAIDQYMMALGQRGVRYHGAVLSFSLQRVDGANPYSKIVPSVVRRLEGDELEATKAYSSMINMMLDDVDSVMAEAGAGQPGADGDMGPGVQMGEAPTGTGDDEVIDDEFGGQQESSKAKR